MTDPVLAAVQSAWDGCPTLPALVSTQAEAAHLHGALARPANAGEVEQSIRIAIWNAGVAGGMGQEFTQALIQRAMSQPLMNSALAALSTPPAQSGDGAPAVRLDAASPVGSVCPACNGEGCAICGGVGRVFTIPALTPDTSKGWADVRELLASAFAAGALACHDAWIGGEQSREPDFSEAASDYAHSIALRASQPPKQAGMGEWRWYVGDDETDSEMMEVISRDEAVAEARRRAGEDGSYIVEARMLLADEEAIRRGDRDTAPLVQHRNGEWITAAQAGTEK